MSIVVGYVQSGGDLAREDGEVRALLALGCQTVRIEGPAEPDRIFKPVLDAVCGFLGPGDQLIVPDVTHLGSSPSAAEALMGRLTASGARVGMLDPADPEETIRTTSPRMTPWEDAPAALTARGRGVDRGAVLALSAHGFGPSQIARKLGVSRMTVWRKLAAAGV
jgi:DNA invertase Pin-like site-specific DNA recombinase